MRNSFASTALVSGALIMLAACSSASSDWAKASAANTTEAYQQFIKAHPSDPHVGEAKALISEQEDNTAWASALQAKTVVGYQGYLDKFPQGANQVAAKMAITDLNRSSDWATAQNSSAADIRAFLSKYSAGPEVDQAKDKLKALTGYHARFATERSESRAQKKLLALEKRLGGRVSDLQVVAATDSKSYYVESGGMTQDEANSLCQSVKKAVGGCESAQD